MSEKSNKSRQLGQNFLVDLQVLDALLDAVELALDDEVLEVGPGKGIVTRELLGKAKKVVAIEKDEDLVNEIFSNFGGQKNFQILWGDIRYLKLNEFKDNKYCFEISDKEFELSQNYKIVASLPYYLTSFFLRKFLESDYRPSLMSLIIQKEVAEKITSNKKESILSLSVKYYANAKIIRLIDKSSFKPIPEVDSAVIQIKPYSKPAIDLDSKLFFRLIKISFSSKRKQLKHNLANGFRQNKEEVGKILKEICGNDKARAEDLSLEDYEKLGKKIG